MDSFSKSIEAQNTDDSTNMDELSITETRNKDLRKYSIELNSRLVAVIARAQDQNLHRTFLYAGENTANSLDPAVNCDNFDYIVKHSHAFQGCIRERKVPDVDGKYFSQFIVDGMLITDQGDIVKVQSWRISIKWRKDRHRRGAYKLEKESNEILKDILVRVACVARSSPVGRYMHQCKAAGAPGLFYRLHRFSHGISLGRDPLHYVVCNRKLDYFSVFIEVSHRSDSKMQKIPDPKSCIPFRMHICTSDFERKLPLHELLAIDHDACTTRSEDYCVIPDEVRTGILNEYEDVINGATTEIEKFNDVMYRFHEDLPYPFPPGGEDVVLKFPSPKKTDINLYK